MKRLITLILIAGCQQTPEGARVLMDFSRQASFYSAPFPSDELSPFDPAAFPNPHSNQLVTKMLELVRGTRGFALAGGVFFSLDGPLDSASLPDVKGTLSGDAKVFLFGIDPDSPDYLKRTPLEVFFDADGGPFGALNQLALVPVQGFPLRVNTRYAAVVLRSLKDAKGRLLARGAIPSIGTYQLAIAALRDARIALYDVAGVAAFTTGDPTSELASVRKDALAQQPPLPLSPFSLRAIYPGYCVYQTTVKMPVYQRGVPPYSSTGGGFSFDSGGKPILKRLEEANLFVTIPRAAMPALGWPAVVYIRAGGGGEVPLADRGVHKAAGSDSPPGTGPAMHFAAVGWAGVQVDGPLGGRRNSTASDEQFLIFNVTNPEALRDNIRQTAVELGALAQSLDQLSIDTSGCAGAGATASIDLKNLALWGHSTGATIAPIALATEPRFRAAILSGAGGSWIENVMQKQKPLAVKPAAELLLGYSEAGRALTGHDPVLTLLQWAVEPADPQAYGRRVLREPVTGVPARHVLMFQGIVDHYILPRIADTTSLSLGLDLAGPALDALSAELASTTHALDVLPLGGRGQIALPASGNLTAGDGSPLTAVLAQHAADGIEDGHEVAFQTEAPQHQYRCFLWSLLRGTPRVPADGLAAAPCQ